MEKVAELRRHIANIQAEMGGLETNIKLLPDNHPLRRQAQVRMDFLKANLEKANADLEKAQAEMEKSAAANEIKALRRDLEHLGNDLTARIRETEKRVIATPAEVAEATKQITEAMKRLTGLETRFDANMKDITERQQPAGPPEGEDQPSRFSITGNHSSVTGRLVSFTIRDPAGHTSRKRAEYSELIAKEYPEVDRALIDQADVHHTGYTTVFVLKEKPITRKQQWWTIDTGNGMPVAIDSSFEPPATAIARFWEIYHSSKVHEEAEFLQLKADILARAERHGLAVKPARVENLDRYLYAFYKTQSPGILDWFFKQFFE
jgi:hypothetical protein